MAEGGDMVHAYSSPAADIPDILRIWEGLGGGREGRQWRIRLKKKRIE